MGLSQAGLYLLQTLKGFRHSGSERRNGVRRGNSQRQESIMRLIVVPRKDHRIW